MTKIFERKAVRSGFTIVELLAVISVMAILAAMILGGAGYMQRKAAEARAKADLEQIKNVLEECRIEKGSYPTNSSFIGEIRNTALADILTNTLKRAKRDLQLTDPWGRGYVYTNARPYSFELRSDGPKSGFSGDDLSNRMGTP
jgi:general secretion pathway protein G